jgi:TolB-like protein
MSRLLALLLLAAPALAADKAAEAKKPLVAVMYFDIQSFDPEAQLMRKGLLQMLTTDLVAQDPQVRVVDRDRLEEIIGEQKLQSTKAFDQSTAVKLGQLLGANYLISGTVYANKGNVMFMAQARSVELGQVLWATKVSGPNEDVFEAEQKLVTGLIEALAKAEKFPPPEPVKHAAAKVPVKVLQKYGAALDALDKKDKATAKAKLQEVVKEQPDFVLASLDLDKLMK